VCGGGHVMGGTGPATFAGSLVMDLATDIAPAVLVHLLKPGARTMFMGDVGFAMNMRSGSPDFGAIGTSLHQVARAQLARRYSLPCGALACGVSSSKTIDFQCGYEKAISVLTAAMCGSNVIWLHGGIHGELTHHPVQAILDDDIAGMIGRFIRGIEVNEDTLAVDLIDSVGPIPGHYLNTEHTRKWWAREQFVPKAADRSTPHEWAMNGQRTALDYARERMDDLLASHEISKPLTGKEEAEIERILKEGYAYYKKKGMV
jgi:trimethylamine--corrinoid protein Co-methyltransferase